MRIYFHGLMKLKTWLKKCLSFMCGYFRNKISQKSRVTIIFVSFRHLEIKSLRIQMLFGSIYCLRGTYEIRTIL